MTHAVPAGLRIEANVQVLAHLADKSAHSDIVDVLLAAVASPG